VTFAVPAHAYDAFVGRYSYGFCEALAQAAGVTAESSVLDVGAGTGAGTAHLVELVGAERVAAVDPSEPFVDALRERVPGADVRVASAESLPFDDGTFDAVLAQLVINFLADPDAGVAEMRRVSRPRGGIVAACVWGYRGEMTLLRAFWDSAETLDPEGVRDVDERTRMRFGERGELGELWRRSGLGEVEEGEIVVPAEYEDFEDLWKPFTQGVGPAGHYAASRDPEQQEALKSEYRRRLVVSDGAFQLSARVVRSRPDVTGALLVGGASTRFGSPKALVVFEGETLAERAYRTLTEAFERVIVVGKAKDGLELPFPVLDDGSETRAAIVGVAAALRLSDAERVVVLPTDMPFVTTDLLLALAEASEGVEAAVPHTGPLPGAYGRSALSVLERRIASGDLALYRACVELEPRVLRWDEDVLANVNEPRDLQ
jgi:molybdopterin-guanine dinucleotide biosynthesis protein A/SAM-dependent methyltransferase